MLDCLEQPTQTATFDEFITSFRRHLDQLFNQDDAFNRLSLSRGLPADFKREIMNFNPLSVAVPSSFGGRGMHVNQCLQVLAAASYESLSLSLMFGINIALFLEPLAKYGQASVQQQVFPDFMNNQAMGGLMITEPAYGSDALNMRTSYIQEDNAYHVKGQKHWQGLTGAADYWLVAARKQTPAGELVRDIDFMLTMQKDPAQQIHVSQTFNNLGLYAIPYGVNEIDLKVPLEQRLQPESTGIKLMLDLLHRSRLQFPGMGVGFIKRLMDEALAHCDSRRVAGAKLNELDAVKQQLSRLQAAYTLSSAMCIYSSGMSSIAHDLSGNGVDANAVKALVTDLMQESAQISLQLAGAKGYRLDHHAGRAVVDSRPFQIFEGSNEMLYAQIAESVLKLMRKAKETNFVTFLESYSLTQLAAPMFASLLSFSLGEQQKQRELVLLGRIIARIICFQFVLQANAKGFNGELTEIARAHIHMDLANFIGQYESKNYANPTSATIENAEWASFLG